jgi:8-oxo-dGTP pyrophosphatase MutT (NUDIX family)
VRELEEETGYVSSDLVEIGRVEPNPAFLSNRCWTYLALGCRADGEVSPDPSEEIAVTLARLEDFGELIDRGGITHSLVIAAHDHLQRGIRRNADWAANLPCF